MRTSSRHYECIILFFVCMVLGCISVCAGRIWIPPIETAGAVYGVFNPDYFSNQYTDLVLNLRLPRTVMVLVVGAALSGCGVTLQAVYRNPLVSPYILGISSGSAFGAALAILVTGDIFITTICAFFGGLLVASITWGIDRFTTVIAGMAIGTLCGSLTALIKWIADPFTVMPFITFWLLGSFSRVTLGEVGLVLPLFFVAIILLYLMRWQLNILAYGEETANMLGQDTRLLKTLFIITTTIIIAVSVALCGVIGWIGLVIPHICRMVTGNDHILLLPFSLVGGAIYLLLVDLAIRTIIPGEMPIGIVTGLIGAPFFVFVIWRTRGI